MHLDSEADKALCEGHTPFSAGTLQAFLPPFFSPAAWTQQVWTLFCASADGFVFSFGFRLSKNVFQKHEGFLGIKKARTTADAFSGIHVRNELRTGVILAEDKNPEKTKNAST